VIEQNALAFFTIHDDQMPKVESNEYLQFQDQEELAKLKHCPSSPPTHASISPICLLTHLQMYHTFQLLH